MSYKLICYVFRQSFVRALTADGTQHLPAHMPEKFKKMSMSSAVPPLVRLNTIGDFEMVDLAPKVEGRIRKLDPQVLLRESIDYQGLILFFSNIFLFSTALALLYLNRILNSFLAQRNRLNYQPIKIINQGPMS